MEKATAAIEEDSISFETYRCTSCGEELLNKDQLKALASKYRHLRKAKPIHFAKWGNSLAVRIPQKMVLELNLQEGTEALILREKEGLKIIVG
ncbi:AbrB/MazE/SpoVT family DNA-binding domain-containing protein [Candidatus Woesearchaeota archaeon]|nr:AbrB/MazE/SpoVT family DNA-binding domain-containing protein [Candidatus Woesearchaeota archaeon]